MEQKGPNLAAAAKTTSVVIQSKTMAGEVFLELKTKDAFYSFFFQKAIVAKEKKLWQEMVSI